MGKRLQQEWETAMLALFGAPVSLDIRGVKTTTAPNRRKKWPGGKRKVVQGGDWVSGLRIVRKQEEMRVTLPLRFGPGSNKGMSMEGIVLRLAAVTWGENPAQEVWRARALWGEPGHHGRAPAKQWWHGKVARQLVKSGSVLGSTLDALLILLLAKLEVPAVSHFALGVLTALKLGCWALSVLGLISKFSRAAVLKPPLLLLEDSSPCLPQQLLPCQDASNRIHQFASAATLIVVANPVIKFGFPRLHEVLRAVAAAAEVGRGYVRVRVKARRLGPGDGAVAEELWRQQHRQAAKRLCRLLHDFKETPTLGWIFPLVDALAIETRTILGIASTHFSILGYGSAPPLTQFRQFTASICGPPLAAAPTCHAGGASRAASVHVDKPQPNTNDVLLTAQHNGINGQLPGQRVLAENFQRMNGVDHRAEIPHERWQHVNVNDVGSVNRWQRSPSNNGGDDDDDDEEEEEEEMGEDGWNSRAAPSSNDGNGDEATGENGRGEERSQRHSFQRNGDVGQRQEEDLQQRTRERGEGSRWEYEWEKVDEESTIVRRGVEGWSDWLGLLARAVWLAVVFFPLVFMAPLLWVLGNHLSSSRKDAVRRLIWRMLRWCLEKGGAAFIKWGQWSATREDLFPPDLCTCLGRMHDRAPTHSYRQTRSAIRKYLGRSIEDIFESFEPMPAASGSIAQVHRATLRLKEGDPVVNVAVKVRHPSVALRIHQDFRIMSAIADWVQQLPALKWLNLRQSVDQFSHTMTAQADLRVEARNLLRFSRNFNKLDQTVVFPGLIPELVSEGVLVETFEKGSALHVFLRDRASSLNTQIAAIGVDTYLKMMLTDNFVHTDLHPGNILARMAVPEVPQNRVTASPHPGAEKVQLVLLDFGLAEELSQSVRYNFISFIIHIGTGDGEKAARHLLRFSEPDRQRCTSPDALISDMRSLFADHCNLLRGPIDLNDVLKKVLRLCRKHGVTINSSYASLVVAVCVLVGFAHSLDPMLSIMDAAVPCLFLYNLTGRIIGRIYD